MAILLLALWGGAVWLSAGRPGYEAAVRAAMAIGLAASMAVQIALLRLDGQLTLQTGLPLHLCGLFGVLSIPMLLWRAPQPLYELSAFLAGPAAAVTLLFPAVIESSCPALMRLAFLQLHALVALTPVMLWRAGKPLPTDPRRALVLASGYLVAVAAFNRAQLSVSERRAGRYAAEVAGGKGRRVLPMRAGHAVHDGAAPAGGRVPARGYFRK